MSFKEKTFYAIECDTCGTICASEAIDGHAYWDDAGWAEQCAMDSDWEKDDNDNHYCPNCYEYDNNGDLKPKPKI